MITFRETLEAALIAAIIFSYLTRSGRHNLSRYVWYGISLALIASVSLGTVVWVVYNGLPETFEPLFEATAAFVAVAVLSAMIYWMATRSKNIKREMEKRTETLASKGTVTGLIFLGFIVVFREGLESVLFLTPFLTSDTSATLIGMAGGILTALFLAYAVFVVGMRINLQKFFYFTSIMLILLAAGLAGYGTHELLEYFEKIELDAGWLAAPAYTLNIPATSPFQHKGTIGSIFAVMFGYTTSAEWARVIVHLVYLAIALPLIVRIYRKRT